MSHPYFDGLGRPRIIAHRGFVSPELAKQAVAENTRAAFAAADAAGADVLETDCHLTRDGRVVLIHDPDLSRVAGDPRRVNELNYEELAAIMEPLGGLLTLEDALATFASARFNIDVKSEGVASSLGRIVAPHADRVLLTGFSDANRRAAVRAAQSMRRPILPATSPGRATIARLAALGAFGPSRAIARAMIGFDALQIPERHGIIPVLSKRLIEVAHDLGIEVHVWTVNEPERMRRLISRGVDGVVTDRTDLAVIALR